MLRKILTVAVLLFLWFAGDRAAAFILGVFLDHSSEPVAQLYGGRARSDVVLLGNSRAYRHFDLNVLAGEFGGKVANLALPGGSMELSDVFLEDYIDRYGSPRILIVELSQLMADPEALRNMRPFILRSDRMAQLIREHLPRLYYFGQMSHLFDYNNEFAINAAHKVFAPMPDLLLSGSIGGRAAESKASGQYFVPHEREIKAFRRMIAVIKKRNIDARFVLSPVLPRYGELNRLDVLQQTIRALEPDLHVWDLASGPPQGPQYFVDTVHMNREGVAIFMAALQKQGFFANRDDQQRRK